MRAEDLQAALRPRTLWEAIDLGVALTRRQIGVVALWWLLVVTPLCALIWWALQASPYVVLLVLWLLRPLFGLGQSVALARGLFSAEVSLSELFRAMWAWRGWGLSVLYRRLLPSRSVRSLMGQLEDLGGELADRRWARLGEGSFGATSALASVCWLLKWWVSFSVFLAAPTLFPESWTFTLSDAWAAFNAGSGDVTVLGVMFVADQVGMFVAESLYTAGAFGLYINQRVLRDGWDLELRLRGFGRAVVRGAAVLLAALVVGVGGAWAQDSAAPEPVVEPEPPAPEPEPEPQFAPPNALDETVQRVLGDGDFGVDRTQRRWRLKRERSEPEEPEADEEDDREPSNIGCPVAAPAAGVGGFVAIVLVVMVLLILRRVAPDGVSPLQVAPFTLTTGALPKEPVLAPTLAEADARWAEGDEAGALAALYRGAVNKLIRQGVPAGADHTEGEVLRLARRAAPADQVEAFARLCAAWSQVAYAKIPVGEARYKALRAEWPRWFGEAP
jgi:hypothetical protein